MSFLRHAGRHVHKTVADYIDTHLTTLGWKDPDNTPFGATPITVTRKSVIAGDSIDKAVGPGYVAITLGDEAASEMEELGGPLSLQDYPIFIDVFGDNDATATALATDVRDILMGRFEGTKRWLRVLDAITGEPVAGWLIEFDDIERVRPETTQPHFWQVVKVTASTYFPEVAY